MLALIAQRPQKLYVVVSVGATQGKWHYVIKVVIIIQRELAASAPSLLKFEKFFNKAL